jgi:hypothetical protein
MPRKRPSASTLKRSHRALCFDRAFPKALAGHDRATAELSAIGGVVAVLPSSEQDRLWDTGIAGTPVHYRFSFEVARWLAKSAPGAVSIDWDEIDDTANLDLLLAHLLLPSEDEYFDSGYVSSREWIDMARAGAPGTDFDWLMAQLGNKRLRSFWSQLYNAADIPLAWRLGESRFSKSRNIFPVSRIQLRDSGMRKRPRKAKQEIQRPLEAVSKLSSRDGAKLIDVAMASLAVRHRETWHFNHANPREVYLTDVGQGVAIAVFGLLPEFRFPLECTMGYLILANGVPIGYGGSSIVFRQVNTGINIFDEYRASEASYLWVQVMRVYHALIGCTRFIANPYQFGGENSEALRSGAFWFYYRLGYRPVLPKIRELAQREASRLRHDKQYRSDIKTLRRLSSCDMHLTLPGARANELFEEQWIETSSMLATEVLGTSTSSKRGDAANEVASKLARNIGVRSLQRWSASERRAFSNIAPIVATTNPETWAADDKRSLRELLRAKGGDIEMHYAKLLCRHGKLLNSLRTACRRAERL